MKKEDLLKEMKESIGTKTPIEFFDKMVDVFTLMLNQIDSLEKQLRAIKVQSALAIKWDARVASNMLSKQVTILRSDKDKDIYLDEIEALKKAFAEDLVTQNYEDFCTFWQDTLGWHPFLD
jgi:hypothetical protein